MASRHPVVLRGQGRGSDDDDRVDRVATTTHGHTFTTDHGGVSFPVCLLETRSLTFGCGGAGCCAATVGQARRPSAPGPGNLVPPRVLRASAGRPAPGSWPVVARRYMHACINNILRWPCFITNANSQVSVLDPDHAGLAAKVPPSWLVDEYTKKNMLQGTAERGAILVNDVEMVLVRTDRVKHDDDEHPVHSHTHPRRPRTAPPAATAMSLCRHGEPDMSTRPGLLHCRLPCPCLASNVGARAVAVCGKRARALAALE